MKSKTIPYTDGNVQQNKKFPLGKLSVPNNFIINYNMKWPLDPTTSRWSYVESYSIVGKSDFMGFLFVLLRRKYVFYIRRSILKVDFLFIQVHSTNIHLTEIITFSRPVTELRDVFPRYWFLMNAMLKWIEWAWRMKGKDSHPDPKVVWVRKISSYAQLYKYTYP